MGLKIEKMGLRFWMDEEAKKTEEEKNESELGVVVTEVAIVEGRREYGAGFVIH